MSNRTAQYVEIVPVSNPGKLTRRWEVRNIKGPKDDIPGEIRWYGGWRKYVYHSNWTYYDWDCLRMIADFCEAATKDHLQGKRPTKPKPAAL